MNKYSFENFSGFAGSSGQQGSGVVTSTSYDAGAETGWASNNTVASLTNLNDDDKDKLIAMSQNSKKESLDGIKERLTEKYNFITKEIINNKGNNSSSKILTKNQNKEVLRNNSKLNKLTNDIVTLRRQIEHNENNFKLKNNTLDILKNVAYIFLITIVIIIFKMYFNLDDYISSKVGKNITNLGIYNILIGLVFLYFGSKIVVSLYINRNSNNIINTKYDWHNPTRSEKINAGVTLNDDSNLGTVVKVQTCSPGSHPSKINRALCELNKCICENGTPNVGTACPWDYNFNEAVQSCNKCNDGYIIKDNKCIEKEKKCENANTVATSS